MHDFDKCRFCTGYNVSEDWCDDALCVDHSDYCLDVTKILNKADELNVSITDILNLIRECNPPTKRKTDIYDEEERTWAWR